MFNLIVSMTSGFLFLGFPLPCFFQMVRLIGDMPPNSAVPELEIKEKLFNLYKLKKLRSYPIPNAREVMTAPISLKERRTPPQSASVVLSSRFLRWESLCRWMRNRSQASWGSKRNQRSRNRWVSSKKYRKKNHFPFARSKKYILELYY